MIRFVIAREAKQSRNHAGILSGTPKRHFMNTRLK
jgi:hypothetical protein